MIKQTLCSLMMFLLALPGATLPVHAEELAADEVAPSIVFTEVQANGEGSGTTTQELIELYNFGTEPVNVLQWSVVYVNSSNKETVLYTFSEPFLFMPQTFLIGKNSATANTYLLEALEDFTYAVGTSGLAATGGGLLLKDATNNLVDDLMWVNAASYVNDATVSGLINGKSAQRKCFDEQVIDTNIPHRDFYVGAPTPGSLTCEVTPPPEESEQEPEPTPEGEPLGTNEEVPPAPEPVRLPLLINELFIDPTSPLTDSSDEYVEIYNPNNQAADISGYTLTAGTTTKYKHTFVQGITVPPLGYITVTSKDTTISLSNSGSTVELSNDINEVVDTVSYINATAGAAWARNSVGEWVWTTSPTFAAVNIIVSPAAPAPTVKKAAATKTTTKKKTSTKNKKTNFSVSPPIQINEVYPDPKAPETDAKDEFVELYNPHPVTINITDYTITTGSTKKYSYTFPEGSVITPGGYVTVTSDNSSLSFTNSGGDVILLNNFDKQIDAVTYEKATQGMSYARDEFGKWQWTAAVTSGAQNNITTAAITTSKTSVAGVVSGTDDTPLVPAPQPLPGWALAALGVSAVCYAAYEYRFEARNIIYKLRANRTAG